MVVVVEVRGKDGSLLAGGLTTSEKLQVDAGVVITRSVIGQSCESGRNRQYRSCDSRDFNQSDNKKKRRRVIQQLGLKRSCDRRAFVD
jgi:DNA-directed RNA polymerase subunit N (RpoN/RPB10)